MSRPAEQLDSRIQVVTPENIAFEYRAAGPFSRLGAFLIDLALQFLIVAISFVLFIIFLGVLFYSAFAGQGRPAWEMLADIGAFSVFVLWFLMQWFYGSLFEIWWNGQTPGKRTVGLRVLQADGRPINAPQALLRNLVRLFDALPYMPATNELFMIIHKVAPLMFGSNLLGFTSMALTERRQRLGDLVCGTMVVAEDRTLVGRVEKIGDPAVFQLQEKIPANFRPSRTLSRALSHYVGRRRYFGPARRQEIAKHVGVILVRQFNFPPDTDYDLLLCALYNRMLGIEAATETPPPSPPGPTSPPPLLGEEESTDWETVSLG